MKYAIKGGKCNCLLHGGKVDASAFFLSLFSISHLF